MVLQKLSRKAFKVLGFDPFSGIKIQPRTDLIKIGSDYGGWVVPQTLLDQDSICYCGGCGEDISFDLGLIERFNCQVYGFDPTPRAIAYVSDKIQGVDAYHFFPLGLWNQKDTLKFYVPQNESHVSHSLVNLQKTEDYLEVEVERLRVLMERCGHSQLTLLKIDIEGAEYEVLKTILEDDLKIMILCIEFDEVGNPLDEGAPQRLGAMVKQLCAAGYTLVNIDVNSNYTFVRG